jgi:hypothetical protein
MLVQAMPYPPSTGKSFVFNGSSNYMELPSAVLSSTPLTIVAWFNPDNDTTAFSIASIGGTTARFELLADGATAGDPIDARSVNAGGTTQQATQGDFAPTTWQHAAAVLASATSRTAYLNGVAGTPNTASNSPSGMTKTIIGARYNGGTRGIFFSGKLAHVAIYNIALSGSDIASLATPGTLPTSVQNANLVFYASLQGGIAKDSISNTSLTVVGAVSSTDGPF